ncbi:hypothetical protein FOA52_005309 [Chlamydomonas sp. UWO 241]|nr:hypothetical protein FOA52_005309 [Chlamydomonas sp. UWO 241]
MADTVQYLLEESIPELEDYEKKGYFSRTELKAIIQKRQDFEYRLKRRAALKTDYYRYIEYELRLEELRRLRKQKLGIQGKKSIAETAIVKRVHFIYERASRKFKSDLQLWLDWLAYCKKTKSSKQHSKVVTKALSRHATTPVLWIEAANWDFEREGNVAAARALMQQGLRMCKHEGVMWVEYLRMELLYIQRLRLRREVLGLAVPQEVPGTGAITASGSDATADANIKAAASAVDESEAAVAAVLTGAVARVVYRSAVVALPGALGLRAKLLRVLAAFDFPGVRELEDDVFAGIAADFPADEDAWDLLARRPLAAAADAAARAGAAGGAGGASSSGGGEEGAPGQAHAQARVLAAAQTAAHASVLAAYERAAHAMRTDRMYELFAGYLEARLERLMSAATAAASGGGAEASSSAPAEAARPRRGAKRGRDAGGAKSADAAVEPEPVDLMAAAGVELLAVFLSAHKQRCAPPALYVRWVGWAQRLGQPKMAIAAVRHGCERHASHAPLWSLRLDLEVEARAERAALLRLFRTAAAAVPAEESPPLWGVMLRAVPPGSVEFAPLCDLLVACATAAPSSAGLGSVAADFLAAVRSSGLGLPATRAFYRRFLTLPAAGPALFVAAIELEVAEGGDGTGKRRETSCSGSGVVGQLFEAAVAAHGGHDTGLWLRYAAYVSTLRGGGGDVYWRATKALDDPDHFIAAYRQQLQDS